MAEPRPGLCAATGHRTKLPARAQRPEALEALRRAQIMDATVSTVAEPQPGLYVRVAESQPGLLVI